MLHVRIALVSIALASAPCDAGAQAIPSPAAVHGNVVSPSHESGQFTAKERLGEKWQDEQRIDNCKVPPDKRGTKPRPDTCVRGTAK
jgi:hypothetical protein